MYKYFITSDIHSFFTIFHNTLIEKGFEENNPNHILIICGDVFDRMDEAFELYMFLKRMNKQKRLIYIRGNHEDLLFDCVKQLKEYDGIAEPHHYSNGTVDTILQFKKANIDINEVLDFIKNNSVNYYELGKYIFVHGWVPYVLEDGYDSEQVQGEFSCVMTPKILLDADDEMWKQARWYNGMAEWDKGIRIPDKTIVCGHWHCSWGWSHLRHKYKEFPQLNNKEFKESFQPFIEDGIIALDACTAYSKLCNIIVIDEKNI